MASTKDMRPLVANIGDMNQVTFYTAKDGDTQFWDTGNTTPPRLENWKLIKAK